MTRRVRMSPEGRREVIIKAAIALTREADGCLDSRSYLTSFNNVGPPLVWLYIIATLITLLDFVFDLWR